MFSLNVFCRSNEVAVLWCSTIEKIGLKDLNIKGLCFFTLNYPNVFLKKLKINIDYFAKHHTITDPCIETQCLH